MTVRPAKTQISQGIRPVWSVFAVRMKKAWVFIYQLSAQWRLWSAWVDAQADQSLCWAHIHIVGFDMRRLRYWGGVFKSFQGLLYWSKLYILRDLSRQCRHRSRHPQGTVWSASTLFAIPSVSFGHITIWYQCSNFRLAAAIFFFGVWIR